MNAIDMIAKCMALSEAGGIAYITTPCESKADMKWLCEKLNEKSLPEEPMGDPEAQ